MSNPAFSQQNHDSDEWNHVLDCLERQWVVRELVSAALKEANAAFAAQFTQPDAYKFSVACDRLTKFLELKIRMEDSEQESVVQILQVACAMQENAVNNPTLSPTERSGHYLASTALVPLCKSALQGGVTQSRLWCQVLSISTRAQQAVSNATDALGLARYLDFENMTEDSFCESGNGAGETNIVPSPVPTVSESATPRVSVHDITNVRQAPQLAKPKEKPLVMMGDQASKGPPLGRAHTMPSLSQKTSSSCYSRPDRGPSKGPGRGNGLHALQEIRE